MTKLATYVPDACTFLAFGIPLDGFVEGTFISVTKDVVPFSSVKTPDGTMARMYNSDQTYTVSLTLHSGSDSNDVLTKLWQLDEITQRGKFPIFIKDSSGTDLFFSLTSWIESPASIVKSTSFEGRTWTFKCASAVINIGGNGDPASILRDLVNLATSALPIIEGVL